ncbi:MAG: single-strand DNA-binding protein [Candidatus Magnetoglobus multicellularis str. Araruama]|uniref:Single-stranded DNA-binding protein n=1 Tax=Candidatus Magnetoglobus multicellularis str. Araruama TaxID=890399 RepID=A0A1V1PA63_9BACT|nr:MAG: single-strand DNA-binding protein [Candidatus Magnetoglobus multicellularis str. Araruama]
MYNKATLIGRLGRDPEMRYTPSGMAIANFTIATNETWKDKDGNKQERTEWHKIVAFARLAEICGQYLSKGRLVFIEGRIQTRDWVDKENIKRYTTEIVALEMKMLESKGASSSAAAFRDDPGPSETDHIPAPPMAGSPPAEENLDDVPF